MALENLTFGHALELIKEGESARRPEWPEGASIFLQKGSVDAGSEDLQEQIGGVPSPFFRLGDKGTVTRFPCINSKDEEGWTMTGWVPNQVDMLAEDWCILE